MNETGINLDLNTTEDQIHNAARAIRDILNSPGDEATKQVALKVLSDMFKVGNVQISGNSFSFEGDTK